MKLPLQLRVGIFDRPGGGLHARVIAVVMPDSSHEKSYHDARQAQSAIDEFKHLLRRFIAVDLSGFYP